MFNKMLCHFSSKLRGIVMRTLKIENLNLLMSTSLVEWEPFRFSKWFSFYVMVLIFKRFSFLPTIHRERETGNGHFVSMFHFMCQIQNIQLNAMLFFIKTVGHSKCMTFTTMFTVNLTHNINFLQHFVS